LERHFAARPERVFQALTDPAELVRWWGPEGFTVPECELDVRPGGAWRTCMRSPDGNLHCVSGVYREIVPPKRLVYTWSWETEGPPHETLVTIELVARDGGTDLTLLHQGFKSDDSRDQHAGGWGGCFDSLVQYFAEDSQ
jgi:uncharacterized protein YndB with AHSA1/START domain